MTEKNGVEVADISDILQDIYGANGGPSADYKVASKHVDMFDSKHSFKFQEMAKGVLGKFYNSLSNNMMNSENNLMENADKKSMAENKDALYKMLVAIAQQHLPELDSKAYKLLKDGRKHMTPEQFEELVLNKYGEHIGFGDGQREQALKDVFDSMTKDEDMTVKKFLDSMYGHSINSKVLEKTYSHLVSPVYTDLLSRSQKNQLDLSHDLLSKVNAQGVKLDMTKLMKASFLSSIRAYNKHTKDGLFKDHDLYKDIGIYADKKSGPVIKDIRDKITHDDKKDNYQIAA